MKNALLRKTSVAIITLAVLAMLPARAQTILNFDSLDTTGGPVSGATLAAYFATYGITISGVTASTTVEVNHINSAAFPAPSSPNVLLQTGIATSESYTLNFSSTVANVSITRGEYNGSNPPSTGSGIAYPEWSVTAFAGATNLGSVGEPLHSTFSDVPAATFTLNYGGITSLTFEGNAQNFAGISGPLLDNLTFTATPEPSTCALLLLTLVTICATRWFWMRFVPSGSARR